MISRVSTEQSVKSDRSGESKFIAIEIFAKNFFFARMLTGSAFFSENLNSSKRSMSEDANLSLWVQVHFAILGFVPANFACQAEMINFSASRSSSGADFFFASLNSLPFDLLHSSPSRCRLIRRCYNTSSVCLSTRNDNEFHGLTSLSLCANICESIWLTFKSNYTRIMQKP